MLPVNFNIVLIGGNFPLQSISVSDFEFNHRELQETLRVPVGINAETRGATLQIFPDRLQASVVEVRNVTDDADSLVQMIEPIFEYLGPKSFTAAGHNAQFLLDPSIPKNAVSEATLNMTAVNDIIGASPTAADIHAYRKIPNGATLRTSLLTQTAIEQVAMEFNANFELKGLNAREPISTLRESLSIMVDIATRAQAALQRQEVAS